MNEGWICLHRSIQDHWMWKDEPYDKARAWIDLLLLANYEDKKTSYKGEIITCHRGDVNYSVKYLAERWCWSRHKVSDFLNALEKDGMVVQKRTVHRTVITIVNYSAYQDNEDSKKDFKRTAKGQQADTTNKDNKDNNILPKGNRGTFVPPTIDEVKAYCLERNNSVDAEKWFDFYSSKGWMVGKNKMKDWKACVRTWERNGYGNNGRRAEEAVDKSGYVTYEFYRPN